MSKSKRIAQPGSTVVEFAKGQQRLIAVAMKLFADKGFDVVTVRDIATAAGVSIGLINHHFGSKEGLREAVDREFMRQFEEVLLDDLDVTGQTMTADDISDRVERWIERHVEDWDVTKAYMRRALLEGSDWGANVFERFHQVVRTAVDRMDADGRLRPDVDRLWLPLLVLYMEVGTLLLDPFVERVLGRSGFDRTLWRRRHRAYIDLIYRGVGTPID